MKKIIWIILILIIAGGIYFFLKKRNSDKPVVFETEQMHTGSISNSVTATGTVQPVDTVAVGAQVSGTIQNFYRQSKLYNVGAISKADFETAQSTYNTAKAAVNSARAILAAAQRNLSY